MGKGPCSPSNLISPNWLVDYDSRKRDLEEPPKGKPGCSQAEILTTHARIVKGSLNCRIRMSEFESYFVVFKPKLSVNQTETHKRVECGSHEAVGYKLDLRRIWKVFQLVAFLNCKKNAFIQVARVPLHPCS